MVSPNRMRPLAWLCLLLLLSQTGAQGRGSEQLPLVWPTPNTAFLENRPLEDYLQPTASGRIESALFGCVRNGGRRFHEGIDLKSIARDRRGHPTDPIFAIMPGRVAHVNRVGGNSGYGIYVVLEHIEMGLRFYSLYSHLARVDPRIKPGEVVPQGEVLGLMGNTAGGYTIPLSRAHLHLEIGFQLSGQFDRWYQTQGYGSRNHHGNWNGLNLTGFDPLDFFRSMLSGQAKGVRGYLQQHPVAFRLRTRHATVPDFVRRNPGMVDGVIPEKLAGWEIDFTWFGLPLRWVPLETLPDGQKSEYAVVYFNPSEAQTSCRRMIDPGGAGEPKITDSLKNHLELLFGLR